VELARTSVGDGARIKHHAYLGDAVVGRSVNVGASAITANFDGEKKNTTVIEDNAFIGVGAVLIAPVRIGKGAVVGAGAVVPKNHDVPKGKTVVGVPARPLDKSSTAQTQAAENAAPEERKKEKAVQRADAPLEGGKKTKARARKKARARRKSGARKKNKGLSRKRKAAPRKRKAKIQKRAVRAQKRKSSKKRKGR
jgi:bifunctional N-acetylglucosamine-1-phosphate-uridyltransferase/glucosamine-1-phosphate-acetyltransferase GlmU-like protein